MTSVIILAALFAALVWGAWLLTGVEFKRLERERPAPLHKAFNDSLTDDDEAWIREQFRPTLRPGIDV